MSATILVVGFALAAAPLVSPEQLSGFPAIAEDGKSIAAISSDNADYEGVVADVLLVLDAKTGRVQQRIPLRGKKQKKVLADDVAQVDALVRTRRFQTLSSAQLAPLVGGVDGKAGAWVFSWRLGSVTVKSGATVVGTARVEGSDRAARGACCGDLKRLETRCTIGPSLHSVWFSEARSVLLFGYSHDGTRDGCEGTDQFLVLALTASDLHGRGAQTRDLRQ